MNEKLSLLALLEIGSALSMGVFILVFTFLFIQWIGKKWFDIKQKNEAFGIFMACILFSVGYTVSSVLSPLLSLFRILANQSRETLPLLFSFLVTGALYIGISYALGLSICLLGIFIYTFLTPINEFKELKNNNMAVAFVVGSIIITLSLLSNHGITLLIESLIPYPEVFP